MYLQSADVSGSVAVALTGADDMRNPGRMNEPSFFEINSYFEATEAPSTDCHVAVSTDAKNLLGTIFRCNLFVSTNCASRSSTEQRRKDTLVTGMPTPSGCSTYKVEESDSK
jgi:hypothetical protein